MRMMGTDGAIWRQYTRAQGPKEENEHYQTTLKRANSANTCGSFQEARELFLAVYALSTAPMGHLKARLPDGL